MSYEESFILYFFSIFEINFTKFRESKIPESIKFILLLIFFSPISFFKKFNMTFLFP